MDHVVSKRAERDLYRRRTREVGAEVQLIFFDAPLEVLYESVAQRNLDLPPDTFNISAEELQEWAPLFEVPDADEAAVD